MGIFSLFGKKNGRKDEPSSGKSSSRKPRAPGTEALNTATTPDDNFSQTVLAQRHKARATERKIDAIEFEMSRDIVRSRTTPNTKTPVAPATQSAPTMAPTSGGLAEEFQSTMPLTQQNTESLLGQHSEIAVATLAPTESVPVLEEVAILFASGQSNVAEQMLLSWLSQDGLGSATQMGWFMLFDLYRISGQRDTFETLALEYAGKFETSPPVWSDELPASDASKVSKDARAAADPALPSISFPNSLDANIVKQLDKLQEFSQQYRSLKLEFVRVKQVAPDGCELLLKTLKSLNKSGHDLVLVGAQNLVDQIRAMLEVGRRDEGEAPWLLLLEVLQLLQLEKVFEEASIDYCITFEVSPPSYEAPRNKVLNNVQESAAAEPQNDNGRFVMPKVIEGKTDALIAQISAFAQQHSDVLLDCSRLQRVEFGASAQLLSGLVPLATRKDSTIQFHDVNYMVLALFNAMGLKNVAAIFPRKQ